MNQLKSTWRNGISVFRRVFVFAFLSHFIFYPLFVILIVIPKDIPFIHLLTLIIYTFTVFPIPLPKILEFSGLGKVEKEKTDDLDDGMNESTRQKMRDLAMEYSKNREV